MKFYPIASLPKSGKDVHGQVVGSLDALGNRMGAYQCVKIDTGQYEWVKMTVLDLLLCSLDEAQAKT